MSPERIQLRRARGSKKPAGAVVVTRPTKWGNPFRVDEHGVELAVRLYRVMAWGGWDPMLLEHLGDQAYMRAYEARDAWRNRFGCHPLVAIRTELRGRDLACWCPLDQICHADVLLEIANQEVND